MWQCAAKSQRGDHTTLLLRMCPQDLCTSSVDRCVYTCQGRLPAHTHAACTPAKVACLRTHMLRVHLPRSPACAHTCCVYTCQGRLPAHTHAACTPAKVACLRTHMLRVHLPRSPACAHTCCVYTCQGRLRILALKLNGRTQVYEHTCSVSFSFGKTALFI
jgi:hypothetical protein